MASTRERHYDALRAKIEFWSPLSKWISLARMKNQEVEYFNSKDMSYKCSHLKSLNSSISLWNNLS